MNNLYGIDIVGQTLAVRRGVARHAERNASHGIDSASSVVNFKELLPQGALKRRERRLLVISGPSPLGNCTLAVGTGPFVTVKRKTK
jgi:hypothetical protein